MKSVTAVHEEWRKSLTRIKFYDCEIIQIFIHLLEI